MGVPIHSVSRLQDEGARSPLQGAETAAPDGHPSEPPGATCGSNMGAFNQGSHFCRRDVVIRVSPRLRGFQRASGLTQVTTRAGCAKDNRLTPLQECRPRANDVEIGSPVEAQLWEVELDIVEQGDQRATTVTLEAESEEEAIREAIAEISRVLAFLSPFTKVVGARARRAPG